MNIILFAEDEIGKPLPRNDRRARHIVKILKLLEGDRFSAGIVNGPTGVCTITAMQDGEISFEWQSNGGESDEQDGSSVLPACAPVTILIGMIRPIAAKRLLRDLTTIGITDIRFVRASMSEKSYAASTLWDDYRAHLIEGAEQAGTTALPRVSTYGSLGEGLETLPSGDESRIVLRLPERELREEGGHPDTHNETPGTASAVPTPYPLLTEMPLPGAGTILAVGPERGWTVEEIAMLHRNGFLPARLGSRILKTETACLAAGVIACMKYGTQPNFPPM